MTSTELAKIFGAFFAIMNPFVNLPIFLAMTAGFSLADQRRLAVRITLYSIVMCAIILVAGQKIIGFFGINVDQFRVAGGAVLAHIAWVMLNGETAPSHHPGDVAAPSDPLSVAFYPITFPMIVGPGTIATLIIYGGHAQGVSGLLAVGFVVAVMIAILFVVMYFAGDLAKVLGDSARVITTRLMGMILLAIAVEMIVGGLTVLLPGLAR